MEKILPFFEKQEDENIKSWPEQVLQEEITPKFGDANEMMSSVCVCVYIYTTACEYMAQGMSHRRLPGSE